MRESIFSFVSAFIFFLLGSSAQASTSLIEVTDFGSNPGILRLFYYVPPNLQAGAPLVVVAHGCSQTAQETADHSGWLKLSQQNGFALLFPQTSPQHEAVSHCFRTWMPEHQGRGAGEPLSLKQMIDYMKSTFSLSSNDVFMTGLSAGGNFTNTMMATYPDIFESGAPVASYPYKCAANVDDVSTCAYGYKSLTPLQWGNLARSGYPGYSGKRPTVQAWHGSLDPYIYLSNQYEVAKQWTNVHGIDAVVDWYGYLLGYPNNFYNTPFGATRVETVTVVGMGHAQAVDPGIGAWQCGSTGTYFYDFNICTAYWIGTFFGIVN